MREMLNWHRQGRGVGGGGEPAGEHEHAGTADQGTAPVRPWPVPPGPAVTDGLPGPHLTEHRGRGALASELTLARSAG